MTIRIEVLEGGVIEVLRPHPIKERNIRHEFHTFAEAIIQIRFYLREDIELARKNLFVPQLDKECLKEVKKLKEESPYGT